MAIEVMGHGQGILRYLILLGAGAALLESKSTLTVIQNGCYRAKEIKYITALIIQPLN